MPTIQFPLFVIADWFRDLPDLVAEQLAFFMTAHLGLPDEGDPVAALAAWLKQPLAIEPHAGRAVAACALVDYHLEESGRAETWEETRNLQLDMVEVDDNPEIRSAVNRDLGQHEWRRDQWMAAAASWWPLRAAALDNETIRAWERESLADNLEDGNGEID